jgi:integrase
LRSPWRVLRGKQRAIGGDFEAEFEVTLGEDGVSLATIRKRLGHRNLQTTLRYAEQSDAVADAELRAWRRRATQDH